MNIGEYPLTPRGDQWKNIGELRLSDPYNWLETESAKVRDWDAKQNTLTNRALSRWRHREALRRDVDHFLAQRPAPPRRAGAKCYRIGHGPDGGYAIVVSDAPFSDGEALPFNLPRRGLHEPIITWLQPAPDGKTIAFGVCYDGSENNFIHLLDVASGRLRIDAPPQILMDAWMGGVCWLPDSSGFYFLALDDDRSQFLQRVWIHDLARGAQERAVIPNHDPTDYTLISTSADGEYLIAHQGLFSPRPIAFLHLTDDAPHWRSFIAKSALPLIGFVNEGALYAISYDDGPRGRLVRIELDAAAPEDVRCWRELVGQTDLVLRSVSFVGGLLFVTAFDQASSRVLLFTKEGKPLGEIPLAQPGAVGEPHFLLMTQALPQRGDRFCFAWSSFNTSWGLFLFDPADMKMQTLLAPHVVREDFQVERFEAVTADGVRAPYHVVCRKGLKPGPNPALLYAYGAFNVPTLCAYPAAMTAFIAAGGIYIHAHIRGGGEFGIDWWREGSLTNKHNSYADLYAIAEDVRHRALTSPDLLALTGASNGGLVASVAAIERPDLWRVVVPQVPVTDLVALLRHPYGRYVVAHEFAHVEEPGELERLLKMSPYHQAQSARTLPAIFIDSGAADPRCPPWHARKLAATLQASAPEATILLRVREGVGHGFATPRSVQIDLYTEWLGFVMNELSMPPGGRVASQ